MKCDICGRNGPDMHWTGLRGAGNAAWCDNCHAIVMKEKERRKEKHEKVNYAEIVSHIKTYL